MHAIDQSAASPDGRTLAGYFQRVRQQTLELSGALTPEDMLVQSMIEASPGKWHLAHTTWFFERFILRDRAPDYRVFDERYDYLFNSYYLTVGNMHARADRGQLSRPSLDDVHGYRRYVDAAVLDLLETTDDAQLTSRMVLGINHEQQHQELLLTDIKHAFSCNPLHPAMHDRAPALGSAALPLRYLTGATGRVETGHAGDGFAFDNERPRHALLLHPHALANRPVNNGEYREFIGDGGYRTPALWLSDGWAHVERHGWERPLYWARDLQSEFTLAGMRALDPLAPVCHVSYFEADAFARWAGVRLPREDEWEAMAAAQSDQRGNFLDRGLLHPQAPAATPLAAPVQLFGDVWEWTSSPYVGYPGFRPLAGSLGEYNGKFMNAQWVLRGGSCVTPADHVRASYRNFFHAEDRWQFMGIRLGRDA